MASSPSRFGARGFADTSATAIPLRSRTTGSLTVQNGVHAFFRRFPTPSAVIGANEEFVLTSLSSPFGLAASRYKASCPQGDLGNIRHTCLCAISARALRVSVDLSGACASAPHSAPNAPEERNVVCRVYNRRAGCYPFT